MLWPAEPEAASPADVFVGTTLESYLNRANEANPELLAFEDRYEAAMQRVSQAGVLPDPRIQVTHFVEAVQTRTGTQENAIVLSQMLPWFGQLGSQKDVASAEAEALWFASQDRQLGLMRKVSEAYFEYGYTARMIQLTRENLTLLRQLEPVVEERVRAGGDLNPLLRLKVEIGKSDDRVRSLEQMRLGQSARLAGMLALPPDNVLPWPDWAAPQVTRLDRASLVDSVKTNSPALAMLDRKVASAESRRELARLEGRPDFTVGMNYIQLDSYPGSTVADAGRDPWGVMVGVNIPIWAGRNKAARVEAEFAQSAAENERRDRENMLLAELSAALAALDDANRRLTLYGDELLDLARQAVEITQSSYEGGRATILEVIDSERSLLELEIQFWRAAADAWQQRVAIQAIANQPFGSPTAEP
jgi:outer membrane protein TolC